ncbi:hypothetical protein MA13_contig00028-0002 [Edwardsiella piscicida]|nr:hypothetical protein MA13_contig00028-0002 [Edwardsiella piscicida]
MCRAWEWSLGGPARQALANKPPPAEPKERDKKIRTPRGRADPCFRFDAHHRALPERSWD